MAFNSVFFILIFLPVVVALYYLTAASRWHRHRLFVLILAGLFFYGRSQPLYVPLLVGSALFNYLAAAGIVRSQQRPARLKAIVYGGVLVNAGLLVFLKYASAIVNTSVAALGGHTPVLSIVAPLAISFYTFQQIAFLLDIARGRTKLGTFTDYLSFVSFFPQLLAGPISLHQEIAPQLAARPQRGRALENVVIGLVIFAFGLFKKTVIADTITLWVDPIFDGAAGGGQPGFLAAWGASIAYTLQIYFDFSGYSDMAIGVARMFGILLPLNFFSPFRSRSIAELWQRWHMTLGRWVRLYIFQPLAIPLTRYAAGRELNRSASHVVTTLAPTFLSMLIIGTWHGPNWTYVLFGVMHGTFMCVNEWYNFVTRKRRRKKPDTRAMLALYNFLTVLAFTLAEVPFRSNDISTSMRMFAGMLGLHGGVMEAFTPDGMIMFALIAVGGLIAYLLPNTEQIMTRFKPALEWDRWRSIDPARIALAFKFSAAWVAYISIVLFFGLVFISRGTQKFIYFNF